MNKCYWCGKSIEDLNYIKHKVNNNYELFHLICLGNKLQGGVHK